MTTTPGKQAPTVPPTERPKRDNETPAQQKRRDENLDETLEESFPASDPPSTIPDPVIKEPEPDAPQRSRTPSK